MQPNDARFQASLLEQAIATDFLTVAPSLPVTDAIALMSQQQTSGVLVLAGEQLVGICTERDVVKLMASERLSENLTVAEVMTRQVITKTRCELDDIFSILSLLRQHQIRHLPILDAGNRLVGLITPNSIRTVLQPSDLLKLRQVGEVMTTGVVCAPETVAMKEVVQLMAQHHVSCVVLAQTVNEARIYPLGIITERDILQFQVMGLDLCQIQAREMMSTPLLPIRTQDTLWHAHQLMQQHCIRRLVVMDKGGWLAGLVTQTSILHALDPLEMSATIQALQQVVTEQTVALRQNNAQLQGKVKERQQAEAALRETCAALEAEVDRQIAEGEKLKRLLDARENPDYQYQVGGSLSPTAPSYVSRQADETLYRALLRGEFCYVFTARQMGKSSLRVRTMQRLREVGVCCGVIDITRLARNR